MRYFMFPRPVSAGWTNVLHARNTEYDSYEFPSVTSLIDSPQIYQLELRHPDQCSTNVCRSGRAILGSAVSRLAEDYARQGCMVEKRMFIKMKDGTLIPFKPDLLEPATNQSGQPIFDRHDKPLYDVVDFKVCRAKTFMEGGKPNWSPQLNMYALGCEQNGIAIAGVAIECIISDWNVQEMAISKGNYPTGDIERLVMNRWSDEQAIGFLRGRYALHKAAFELPDEELHCTRAERWCRKSDLWKVRKKETGRTVPNGSCTTEEEAKQLAAKKDYETLITFEAAESVRCRSWCSCRNICHQFSTEIEPGTPQPK